MQHLQVQEVMERHATKMAVNRNAVVTTALNGPEQAAASGGVKKHGLSMGYHPRAPAGAVPLAASTKNALRVTRFHDIGNAMDSAGNGSLMPQETYPDMDLNFSRQLAQSSVQAIEDPLKAKV